MTTVRMIPSHEVVRRTYPRPPPEEKDAIAMAIGKAIDGALSQFGHQLRTGRHPTLASVRRLGEELLEDALAEAAVALPAPERDRTLGQVEGMLRAYRKSEIAGLPRPRTRIFLINGRVGVYAQPDYWDGRRRFFEMKSYRAVPPSPEVTLQLRLFQLAFPGFEATLVCLNRHATPIEVTSMVVPPPTTEETATTLRLALREGLDAGQEKVLEYLEGPFVHYTVDQVGDPAAVEVPSVGRPTDTASEAGNPPSTSEASASRSGADPKAASPATEAPSPRGTDDQRG